MTTLIALLVVAVVVWRAMSKEEKRRALRTLDAGLQTAVQTAKERGREERAAFHMALRTRTPRVWVTPVLVALSVAAFLLSASSKGAASDAAALIASGASYGPLTTNGEWWRLVSAMFVHRGFVSLVIDLSALLQVGLILERLVGRLALSSAYVGAGLLSGLASLSAHPMGVVASGAAPILGLYGLLLTATLSCWVRRSETSMPRAEIERVLLVAAVFLLSSLLDSNASTGTLIAGLTAGILVGAPAATGLAAAVPPPRRIAAAATAILVVAGGWAVGLHGIRDVKPEIERLVSLEQRTAGSYQSAADQFRKNKMSAEKLAALIDQAIVPELQTADARIAGLHGVPTEDEPRVRDAREYLRLRVESWRLRADGLRLTARSVRATKGADDSDAQFRARAQEQYTSTVRALGKADTAERASLEAFGRLKQPPSAAGPTP